MSIKSGSPPGRRVVLLTGPPGIGKTTAIRKIAGALGDYALGGFYTGEIREAGRRCGFSVATFSGSSEVFAHVDFPKRHRVGKYGVDLGILEAFAIPALALETEKKIYLVDEIGKMECLSSQCIAAMDRLLASGKLVVATVARRGGGFIDEVKSRPGYVLCELTHHNRDELPMQIARWLQERGNELPKAGGAS